jgi:hypothetical protein
MAVEPRRALTVRPDAEETGTFNEGEFNGGQSEAKVFSSVLDGTNRWCEHKRLARDR